MGERKIRDAQHEEKDMMEDRGKGKERVRVWREWQRKWEG